MKIIALLVCASLSLANLEAQQLKAVFNQVRYGYADSTGKEVIEAKYEFAADFTEGVGVVKLGGKWGAIDVNGAVVIPIAYESMGSFSEGLGLFKQNGKYGYMDKRGNTIIEPQYDQGRRFGEGLAAVKLGEQWGFLDKAGTMVLPAKYKDASFFQEGLAAVEEASSSNYGFIDKSGKVIIPFLYTWAFCFSEGLAAVRMSDKYGYIDPSGKQVIPFKYDYAHDFRNGQANVRLDGRNMIIDNAGNIAMQEAAPDIDKPVLPAIAVMSRADSLEAARYLPKDIFIYKKNYKLGLAKADGTILTHAVFNKITFEKSPKPELQVSKFMYRLAGDLVNTWYRPGQHKTDPDYIVGYTESKRSCATCNGSGEITIKETEKIWVKPSTSVKGTSTNTQTHADIYSEKKGATVTTTTTTSTTQMNPGYYKDGKTTTRQVKCEKCIKGTVFVTHNAYYIAADNRYVVVTSAAKQ